MLRDIELSLQEQAEARRKQDEASKREMELRQEMSRLEAEAADAIAVEDARLSALEAEEAAPLPVMDASEGASGLAMSPFTWSATDGLPDQFWATSVSVPWVLSDETTHVDGIV